MSVERYATDWFSAVDLSNTPVVVGEDVVVYVEYGVLSGGAAAEQVTFQSTAGTPVDYFTILVPAGREVHLGRMKFEDGLQVVTESAAGDVGVFLATETTK